MMRVKVLEKTFRKVAWRFEIQKTVKPSEM
jgi:hypothetical protein